MNIQKIAVTATAALFALGALTACSTGEPEVVEPDVVEVVVVPDECEQALQYVQGFLGDIDQLLNYYDVASQNALVAISDPDRDEMIDMFEDNVEDAKDFKWQHREQEQEYEALAEACLGY